MVVLSWVFTGARTTRVRPEQFTRQTLMTTPTRLRRVDPGTPRGCGAYLILRQSPVTNYGMIRLIHLSVRQRLRSSILINRSFPLASALVVGYALLANHVEAQQYRTYIGTYTTGERVSRAIYSCVFD